MMYLKREEEPGVDVELIVGKIYRVVKPKRNDRSSDVRIIDESGDDYLTLASLHRRCTAK